jgi:DNA-binding HxlR family transcriptional regulator
LEKKIPAISSKVLTQQLREMERDSLIVRTIFPEVTPHVEYSLNKMGVSLFSLFYELRKWGLEENETREVHCSKCSECRPINVA